MSTSKSKSRRFSVPDVTRTEINLMQKRIEDAIGINLKAIHTQNRNIAKYTPAPQRTHKPAAHSSRRYKQKKIKKLQSDTKHKLGDDADTTADFICGLLVDPEVLKKVNESKCMRNYEKKRRAIAVGVNREGLMHEFKEAWICVNRLKGSKSNYIGMQRDRNTSRQYLLDASSM
eukprot:312226_1